MVLPAIRPTIGKAVGCNDLRQVHNGCYKFQCVPSHSAAKWDTQMFGPFADLGSSANGRLNKSDASTPKTVANRSTTSILAA